MARWCDLSPGTIDWRRWACAGWRGVPPVLRACEVPPRSQQKHGVTPMATTVARQSRFRVNTGEGGQKGGNFARESTRGLTGRLLVLLVDHGEDGVDGALR